MGRSMADMHPVFGWKCFVSRVVVAAPADTQNTIARDLVQRLAVGREDEAAHSGTGIPGPIPGPTLDRHVLLQVALGKLGHGDLGRLVPVVRWRQAPRRGDRRSSHLAALRGCADPRLLRFVPVLRSVQSPATSSAR